MGQRNVDTERIHRVARALDRVMSRRGFSLLSVVGIALGAVSVSANEREATRRRHRRAARRRRLANRDRRIERRRTCREWARFSRGLAKDMDGVPGFQGTAEQLRQCADDCVSPQDCCYKHNMQTVFSCYSWPD